MQGVSPALASARLGMKTAIFTITLDNIGMMSTIRRSEDPQKVIL